MTFAAAVTPDESLWMLKTLGFAVPVFYGVYYAIAAVLSAAFGAAFDGTEPFDSADFTPVVVDGHYRSLATWLAMVLTFTAVGPWLIYFTLRDSRRAVDAATCIHVLHLGLVTAVTQTFPENWVWWATILPCMLFMGRMAQFLLISVGFAVDPHRQRLPAPLRALARRRASGAAIAPETQTLKAAADA